MLAAAQNLWGKNHLVLFAGAGKSVRGELRLVKPENLYHPFYLEDLHTGPQKICDVGNYLSDHLFTRLAQVGVKAILCGSTSYDLFLRAQKTGITLGVFSAFGQSETPPPYQHLLQLHQYKQAQIQTGPGVLVWPEVAARSADITPYITRVALGQTVKLLQKPYYGLWGRVVRIVSPQVIAVELLSTQKKLEVCSPNFLVVHTNSYRNLLK